MITIKRLIIGFSIILSPFVLVGCGGGGSSSNGDSTTKINVVQCSTNEYTNIQDGDILVEDDNTTQVTIIHSSDGSKKVCVVSGSAYLER